MFCNWFLSSTGEDFLIHPNWTIQFFMIWVLINHYTGKIQYQRMDSPNNYELWITITRTSVRLYEGMPHRCVDYPTIMHYELWITNWFHSVHGWKKISTKKGMNRRPSLNLSYVMKSFILGILQICNLQT